MDLMHIMTSKCGALTHHLIEESRYTSKEWLLDIALDYLCLGRAEEALGNTIEARSHLNQAVDGLRLAGQLDHLPRGLLARAAFFRATGAYEDSRRDLSEVIRLAKRCEMRLFECDAHLEYTRLVLAEGNPDGSGRLVARAALGSGGFSMDFPLVLSPAPIAHVSTSPPSIPDSRISRVRFWPWPSVISQKPAFPRRDDRHAFATRIM